MKENELNLTELFSRAYEKTPTAKALNEINRLAASVRTSYERDLRVIDSTVQRAIAGVLR